MAMVLVRDLPLPDDLKQITYSGCVLRLVLMMFFGPLRANR
jgi:hypothetical protein